MAELPSGGDTSPTTQGGDSPAAATLPPRCKAELSLLGSFPRNGSSLAAAARQLPSAVAPRPRQRRPPPERIWQEAASSSRCDSPGGEGDGSHHASSSWIRRGGTVRPVARATVTVTRAPPAAAA
ncbi:hypothetical protein PVAP13_3KG491000 [Panicum virgatum]|uniref:Uncharacterized protein n=1 Tax=Panicum virgatum TaxID=38727 RepID=A0A8T0V4A4_PANVG|nr:hypothetical protein PVAP13_3KG491000 [Panicum virgatum]